jgi:YHS domain-containing protein
MKILFTRILFLLALTLTAFSSAAFSEDPIETGTFNNKAIYGYDTVAYFTQGKPVKGEDKITSEWRGATWHFSSAEHKAMFDEAPEKFAPQYGGYCSYAMSRGKFVGVDEEAFTVLNGKLYVNLQVKLNHDLHLKLIHPFGLI